MPTTCFVTSTFRGRMTITMGYQDSERAREGTRTAMDLFRRLSPVARGRMLTQEIDGLTCANHGHSSVPRPGSTRPGPHLSPVTGRNPQLSRGDG